MRPRELLGMVLNEHEAGRPTALCAIVATRGSTPQPPGTIVVVDAASRIHGTLGGGCVEADVRRRACAQMSQEAGHVVTFHLDGDFGYDGGMICGGHLDVAIQAIQPRQNIDDLRSAMASGVGSVTIPIRVDAQGHTVEYRINLEDDPRLLIAGAGHIGRILAEFAVRLGFVVHVIDDRACYANRSRFSDRVKLHVGPIASTLQSLRPDANTYIVIVTRGHQYDHVALQAVIQEKTKYVGMIGSRRKIAEIFDDLREAGVPQSSIMHVHAPIGINIGAVTAEEIALSIASELVRVRRRDLNVPVEGPFPCFSSNG